MVEKFVATISIREKKDFIKFFEEGTKLFPKVNASAKFNKKATKVIDEITDWNYA